MKMQNQMLSKDHSFSAEVYREVVGTESSVRENETKKSFIPKAIGALVAVVVALFSLALRNFNFYSVLDSLRLASADIFLFFENTFYFLFTKGATEVFGSAFVDFFLLLASFLTAVFVVCTVKDEPQVARGRAEIPKDTCLTPIQSPATKYSNRLFIVYSVFRN